ncbi:FRG domain-containing protein, partial [Flavobacterium filum]|uniref:FRG domain-containing protein n=1 Tax=Flavobacterium filum TaxID=370974 RepID=UPI0023EF8F1A
MGRASIETVTTVKDFVERIIDKSPEAPSHYRFYRGHPEPYTKNDIQATMLEDELIETLLPSIYRKTYKYQDCNWIKNEGAMFKEAILRNPDDFVEEKSTFEKLVKMQHYSLPTRLLDITSNALIALYFACLPGSAPCKKKNLYKKGNTANDKQNRQDGYVFIFDIPREDVKYYDSD